MSTYSELVKIVKIAKMAGFLKSTFATKQRKENLIRIVSDLSQDLEIRVRLIRILSVKNIELSKEVASLISNELIKPTVFFHVKETAENKDTEYKVYRVCRSRSVLEPSLSEYFYGIGVFSPKPGHYTCETCKGECEHMIAVKYQNI